MSDLLEKPILPVKEIEVSLENFSDRDLIRRCKEFGTNARRWSREFAYLLPEVMRRGLHRRCKCESIFHFAAKYAGMNREVVGRVLSLHGKLKGSSLWYEIRNYGWAKLQIIAGVIEEKPVEEWRGILKMPRGAMQVIVQKIRNEKMITQSSFSGVRISNNFVTKQESAPSLFGLLPIQNASSEKLCYEGPSIQQDETLIVATSRFSTLKMTVSPATELKFKSFKQNLEKELGKTLTYGETLELLMKRLKNHEEGGVKKRKPVQSVVRDQASPAKSRYINVSTRQAVSEKYGIKCVSPWCKNPSLEPHHPERFALDPSHDSITPLCRTCHQLAHFGFIKNELQEPENWQLVTRPHPNSIDLKVQQYWRAR